MAGSKFAYVRNFELPDPLLPGTFMVLRLDGHAFHRLSAEHDFVKPNDERALQLMDHAARDVMNEFKDIVLAFGESDEYSFLFRRSSNVYNRRQAKILTTIASLFTSSYVYYWQQYLPNTPLKYPPSFDARIVLYPSAKEVRDYFAWRQADTHINNLYNTIFWALVLQGGETTTQAHETLKGTVSKDKHEMLFSRFDINYNLLPARFRKGSILIREPIPSATEAHAESGIVPPDVSAVEVQSTLVPASKPEKKSRVKTMVVLTHCDIIGDEFWAAREYLLAD